MNLQTQRASWQRDEGRLMGPISNSGGPCGAATGLSLPGSWVQCASRVWRTCLSKIWFRIAETGPTAKVAGTWIAVLAGLAATAPRVSAASNPEEERASFKVLDGFEVNLFASELEGATKPIQLRFDADGRLWLVGSTVYPQVRPGEEPDDKVTVLEDRDGDGRCDHHRVFAGGLAIPTGLEVGDGGVYVGAGTELLHLGDTDGDGKADQRRVVLRGFGTGDTHQTINSFTWGPSGELMMSQGLHALSRVETPWGVTELRQSGLFRLWPRRLQLEAFWSGAMGAHNPFGTVFDRWAQPFVFAGNGHGIYHLTPAMIATDHFLLQAALWNQGRKFGGADVVENSHWPVEFQGEVVSGGYLQNSVERFRLADAGSSFRAERLPPLIESTNTSFRIVDVRFGPDGALYLCDWCNPVIGHYQTSLRHPDRDKTRGRIWRVTARGRPLVPRQSWTTKPVPVVVEGLRSAERWDRQMAKRVLIDRLRDWVIPELDQWLGGTESAESAESRWNQVEDPWLMEIAGVYAGHEVVRPDFVARFSRSKLVPVRAYAARLIGHWADRLPSPLPMLSVLVGDPEPRVRLEAVVACAYVKDPRSVEVAAIVADAPMDDALRYAFQQTVHATKAYWREANAKGDLRFEGRAHRLEAFASADRSGETAAAAVSRLRRIGEVALDFETIGRLASLVMDTGNPEELAVLLDRKTFTVGTRYDSDLHARILNALARRSRERSVRPTGDLDSILRGLAKGETATTLTPAVARLAGVWTLVGLRDEVANWARDIATSMTQRQAAVEGLGYYGAIEDRDLLASIAGAAMPSGLRREAIRGLARLGDDRAAGLAASLWSQDGEDGQATEVVDSFLHRRDGATRLAEALRRTVPSARVAEAVLAHMASIGRRDAALAEVLQTAVSVKPAVVLGLDIIPELAAEVRRQGDAAKGKDIFERAGLGCVACHAVNGGAGKLGPDLGALGTSQNVEFIIGAILEPNREVKEGFTAHEFEMKDGEVYQGYLRNETATEIAFLDQSTKEERRVARNLVASMRQIGSLMPDGLEAGSSREEFRDLVAYLSRLGRRD
jgi:putative heme-binding domain-containing protein